MGNFRYKRITDEEAKRLQRQYCEDNLFKLLMPVLEYYGKCHTELSPVEIWSEALRLTCELVKSEHPEVKIKEVVGLLANEYLSFSDCSERSRENGHLYDSALDDLSAWQEKKNNEPKGCKFFVQGNMPSDEQQYADSKKSISLKSQCCELTVSLLK